MSPDIEWHVGDDADQETIAHTANARRPQRKLWLVLSAIGLGVVLGFVYRSIPEPPPKPITPAPVPATIAAPLLPLASAESLDAAIERDARYLAAMKTRNGITFSPGTAQWPQAYADWYAALQNAYGGWGPPAYETLYTVFETGTLPSGIAWVKLGQFRHGDFYRQTRFYRPVNDRWSWTLPEASFWSGATATSMAGDGGMIGPITITYPIEDVAVASAVLDRFTRAYQNLCESLQCAPPHERSREWTPGLGLSITIRPLIAQPAVQDRDGTVAIDLPSPRVVGYYEDANARGDPYVSMAYATLIKPVVQLASGAYTRWETDRGGALFLQAIATWKQARLGDELPLMGMFYQPTSLPPSSAHMPDGQLIPLSQRYVEKLHREQLVPLVTLWDWPTDGQYFGPLEQVATQEAEAVVIYIEERYGQDGVVRLLNALGKAHSLEEAIEAALPVSFAEFDRQWSKWIAGG